jgi:hypothetical protein
MEDTGNGGDTLADGKLVRVAVAAVENLQIEVPGRSSDTQQSCVENQRRLLVLPVRSSRSQTLVHDETAQHSVTGIDDNSESLSINPRIKC